MLVVPNLGAGANATALEDALARPCPAWSSTVVASSPPAPGFAHIDLALPLVSGLSRELAAMAARYLLIDERPTPTLDADQNYLGTIDEMLTGFESWVRAHLAEPISIADA